MINQVTLIGNLGQDPELRTLEGGAKFLRFSMATNENYKDRAGEWQTITTWHNVVIWRDAAERLSRTLRKGSMVYVEGKLTYREWEDENKVKRNITEIRAMVVRKLDRDRDNNRVPPPTPPADVKQESKTTESVGSSTGDDSNDDLPF